jgi:Ca2+-binding RTX toxin-like protein
LVYWLEPSYLKNSTAANPAPALGARINALNGEFKWQVPLDQAPGVYTFRVGVTDHGSDAAATFYDLVIEVQNQSPIGPATLPPSQIEEGQSAVLDAGAWSDPEGRSLTYSWDVNGDNVFGDATGAAPTLTWPQLVALGIPDGTGGIYNVKVQVNDGDGGITTSSSVSLTVNNVAPTAGVSGPSSLARGASGNYTFTATDPSSVDQAAGFTFAIDWNGDGSDVQVVSGASGLVVAHTFTTVGARTIKVTATDKDGGVSNQATRAVSVSAVQVVSGDLVWTGSAAADIVHFEQLNATTVRVTTTVDNGLSLGSSFVETFNNITGIVKGSGLAGDDILDASLLTTTSTRLDGGTGNNTLYGGGANDVLIGGGNVAPKNNGPEGQQGSNIIVGGAGDDVIYGNAVNGAEGKGGNNILLGGDGDDTIYGNWTDGGEGGGRNILVGGADADTLYDYKIADGAEGKGSILISGETLLGIPELSQVMLEWASTHTYNDRVANILGPGAPGRLNGGAYLHPGSTVTNDAAVDHLWGSTGGTAFNWFLYTLAVDEINRAKIGETHTFL